MTDRWQQLLAADPSERAFEPAEGLLNEIRQAPIDPAPKQRRRFWHRLSRGAAVIVAALLVGAAVAWAATGISPLDRLERIWGIDRDAGLSVDENGYGLDDFSILEPMTDKTIDELPERLKFWLATVRTRPSLIRDDSVDGGFRRRWIQEPRQIAGWGETTTSGGNGVPPENVAVVSMSGRICFVWDGYRGGSCGSVGEIDRKGPSTSVNGFPAGTRWVIGLVSDQVATLRIDHPGYGEVPVSGNIFQATDIPDDRFFLIGRDDQGSIVTRILVGGS